MQVKLNTNLFPIISVAMYGTYLEPDSMFDNYMIETDREDGYINFTAEYFWDNFQNDKYIQKIQELAQSFINGKHKVGDVLIVIEAGEIYSPKFYNYSNDEIDLKITFNEINLLKEVQKDIDTFDSFLRERYSSRDGFNSFTSNNYNDWLDDYMRGEDTAYGSVLTYLFKDELDEYRESFTTFVYDSHLDYRDFVEYEVHDKEVDVLKAYVKENYNTIDLDTIDYESFEFESLEENDIKKILKELVFEIDNYTLSLF